VEWKPLRASSNVVDSMTCSRRDRGDDLDASVEEAQPVKVGAQVVGRAGDHKGEALLGEFVDEVVDDVGGGGVDARDHRGVEDDPLSARPRTGNRRRSGRTADGKGG
jgi:hypothetical protein